MENGLWENRSYRFPHPFRTWGNRRSTKPESTGLKVQIFSDFHACGCGKALEFGWHATDEEHRVAIFQAEFITESVGRSSPMFLAIDTAPSPSRKKM